MGSKGRVGAEGRIERDHLETAQAALVGVLVMISEVTMRNQQAIRRSKLVEDVLQPSVERLSEVGDELRLVQREIGAAWSEGQSRKWRAEQ